MKTAILSILTGIIIITAFSVGVVLNNAKAQDKVKIDSLVEQLRTVMEECKEKTAGMEARDQEEKRQNELYMQKKHKELLSYKNNQHNAEMKLHRIVIFSSAGGLILLFVLSVLLYSRYKLKQKTNLQLEEKNSILEKANLKIIKQKEIIEEKNKNILASIRYAKQIQKATLPSGDYLEKVLAEHFILFKPKDVVSGDFYWTYQTKDNKVIWIAADCTGHGVPGAFMSMIGNTLLNEIVIEKGISSADEILNELKNGIIKTMGQQGEKGHQRDGMDAALCVWDKTTNNLEFAGANNPLYLIKATNGLLQLEVIKSDRQPVGYDEGQDRPFTNHRIQLQKDDIIYTFSDGLQDQFGGLKNKKLTPKRLKQALLSIHSLKMNEQKKKLNEIIESWKGEYDQTDDMVIIGVRI